MIYPHLNPIAFHIYTWPVHWYGLMYLTGFVGGWGLLALRLRQHPTIMTQTQLSDLIFAVALGVILGGRVGYMVFYQWHELMTHPLSLFKIWQGGMSFHGGLIGVLIAILWCAHTFHRPFLKLTDFITPVVPIGLGAGRIGNFINGELWGRPTTMPWGMVFPEADALPRHPSQLYEFGLEGVLLFLILWCYSSKPRPMGAVSGWFAILYGVFRCVVECFREPDVGVGYIGGWLTEGQLLSMPLIVAGVVLLYASQGDRSVEKSGRGRGTKREWGGG
jgi:phosphatidylglycerol:prolipoprotein diacylglycerol transferase